MWSSDSGQDKDAESAATLRDIGEVLRRARESQGMSCDQLAHVLNMGTEQLEALESGDCERLPEPVFITAMTRRVASKLHLDSDPLVQRLQTALASSANRKTPAPEVCQKPSSISGAASKARRPWGRLITAAFGIAAVAGGAMVLASQRRTVQTASIPAPQQNNPPAEVLMEEPPANGTTMKPKATTPVASITITSQEPSWLSIRTSDGSEVFEGTLADSKTLPGDADVEIYAGRPDLVLISRGDETPKALGTIEQVRWYKLNP